MGHSDCQFLRNMPSSHKGWKNLYSYACLPTPFPHSEAWHMELLELPNLTECRVGCPCWASCPFLLVVLTVQEHNYDIRILLNECLLSHFRLSPFPIDGPTLIGSPSFPFTGSFRGVLAYITYFLCRRHHVGGHAQHSFEIQEEELGRGRAFHYFSLPARLIFFSTTVGWGRAPCCGSHSGTHPNPNHSPHHL